MLSPRGIWIFWPPSETWMQKWFPFNSGSHWEDGRRGRWRMAGKGAPSLSSWLVSPKCSRSVFTTVDFIREEDAESRGELVLQRSVEPRWMDGVTGGSPFKAAIMLLTVGCVLCFLIESQQLRFLWIPSHGRAKCHRGPRANKTRTYWRP